MAYTINRYNGAVQSTVQDGTINQSTELKFIGKNYAGYGEAQNENFMFLLENFAGSTTPSKPVPGMIWYDNSTQKIKVYNGTIFKTSGSTEVATSAPTGLVEGDLWWNSTIGQLYVKNASAEWVLVGPQGGSSSTVTRMISTTLTDSVGSTHDVQEAVVGDEVVYIISKDEFTNSVGTAVTGFDVIKKGITLINTVASTNGVTSTAHRFWGTASNAIRLNGRPAADYVTTDSSTFSSIVAFGDNGYTVGLGADLIVKIDTDNETPIIQLVRNLLRVKNSAGTIIYYLDSTGIHPNTNSAYDLGKNGTNKWRTVYADTFSGISTEASTLTVAGTGRAAATAATANTIAARDSSGNLTAVIFNGTATKARYADLAEKYSTATELPAGTAVAVCACEGHEVEPASASNHCIGVVSTDPAYMMNSEAEGQYIALKGRVPVRVKGAVKKGQAVYAMTDGVCTTLATTALVGLALESNDNIDEKLVECVLKV